MPFDLISGLSVPEYFGIHPRITDNNRTGGSAFQTLAIAAALALDAGLCDVALIAYGSNLRTGAGAISPPPPDPFEWAYKARYQTGRASGRERVWPDVENSVVAVSVKKNIPP